MALVIIQNQKRREGKRREEKRREEKRKKNFSSFVLFNFFVFFSVFIFSSKLLDGGEVTNCDKVVVKEEGEGGEEEEERVKGHLLVA